MEAAKFHAWLKDAGGCADCRSWSKGLDLLTIWNTCERGHWLEWLLNACDYQWTAQAYEAYQKATAPAYKAYQKAKATSIRGIIPYPFEKEGE